MSLKLPPGFFDRLAESQRARGYVDDVTSRRDVVWLHTDVGPSFYLTRAGDVLSVDELSQTEDRYLETPASYVALVAGAATISEPELLSLLPSRTEPALDCPRCKGSRYASIGRDLSTGAPASIICPLCSGLGWIVSSRQFRPREGEVLVAAALPGLLAPPGLASPDLQWDVLTTGRIKDVLTYCRLNLVHTDTTTVVILVNAAPAVAALRETVSDALSSHVPGAVIAWLEDHSPGTGTLTTMDHPADLILIAIASAAYSTICGWDESEIFTIRVNSRTMRVALRWDGKNWYAAPV